MKTDARKGLGCLFLFALPFVGFGLFAGYRVSTTLRQWFEMRSWVEVPAELVAVDLETHRDSDSTTFEAQAEYRYWFGGIEFTGTRVALHSGADNVGDFQEDTYRELSRVRSAGGRYRCFVDPDSPSRSVLDRNLRWGLLGFYSIFVIVFGGGGVGLVVGGLYGSRRLARENELRALSPTESWRQKDEWRSGKIPATRAVLVTSAIFAVVWNAISAPLLFLVPRELARGNVAASIGLLFPVIGVGLFIWAFKNVARLFKFGDSVLEMRTMPGVIGGRLEGVVRASKGLRRAREIEVQLSAVGRARIKSGSDTNTEETLLWERTNLVQPKSGFPAGFVSIPVAFDVPPDLPPTDETDPNYQIVWRIDVRAEVPGIDYEARFDVPVFRTAESAPVGSGTKVEIGALDLVKRLKKVGVRIERLGVGQRLMFPGSRTFVSVASSFAVFVVLTGIAVVLYYSDAPRLFPFALGAFDVLVLFAFLDHCLYSSRIEVQPGALSFRGGWFGGGKERRWSSTEVKQIVPTRGPQSGNRLYYRLELVTQWNKRKKIARGIPDLETAESLARELERTLRS